MGSWAFTSFLLSTPHGFGPADGRRGAAGEEEEEAALLLRPLSSLPGTRCFGRGNKITHD